jgi:hypothetical protein
MSTLEGEVNVSVGKLLESSPRLCLFHLAAAAAKDVRDGNWCPHSGPAQAT